MQKKTGKNSRGGAGRPSGDILDERLSIFHHGCEKEPVVLTLHNLSSSVTFKNALQILRLQKLFGSFCKLENALFQPNESIFLCHFSSRFRLECSKNELRSTTGNINFSTFFSHGKVLWTHSIGLNSQIEGMFQKN